jgi:NAD(P)-dependent dehydrogenase (short-subunit alcohol dehydrogenase family)
MTDTLDELVARISRRAALAGGAVTLTAASQAWAQATPGTVLITGASRGIGFGMARAYAAQGYRVIATARRPGDAKDLTALARDHKAVQIEALDVTDMGQIDALAAKLTGTAIDILINNAGISGDSENQVFGQLKFGVFDTVMHTNVRGPLKMAEAFLAHVASSTQKKLVNISSTEGSIGTQAARPDFRNFFYRASKAALNMVMVNVAKAVAPQGVIVGILSPGFVMSDFTKGLKLPMMISVEESAAKCIEVIGMLIAAHSGKFLRHTGDEAPW